MKLLIHANGGEAVTTWGDIIKVLSDAYDVDFYVDEKDGNFILIRDVKKAG